MAEGPELKSSTHDRGRQAVPTVLDGAARLRAAHELFDRRSLARFTCVTQHMRPTTWHYHEIPACDGQRVFCAFYLQPTTAARDDVDAAAPRRKLECPGGRKL